MSLIEHFIVYVLLSRFLVIWSSRSWKVHGQCETPQSLNFSWHSLWVFSSTTKICWPGLCTVTGPAAFYLQEKGRPGTRREQRQGKTTASENKTERSSGKIKEEDEWDGEDDRVVWNRGGTQQSKTNTEHTDWLTRVHIHARCLCLTEPRCVNTSSSFRSWQHHTPY